MNDSADLSRWREIQRLFDEALDQPPDRRDAYLDAEARDVEVAATVRRLLAVHDDYRATQDIVRGSAAIAQALRAFTRDDGQLPPGTELAGGYRIESLLGSGGMGSVYLATRDVGGRTQRVALKIAPPAPDHARIVAHLRRERAILAGLDHPNIARLIEAGELPDGRPYFAMEYVDGTRITDYCDEHRLGLPARLALFATVCDAVAYAHRRFVLHRDLKPGNILVDRDGRVRLLDFGIAKAIDDAGVTDATVDGGFFSPDCAAPEQVAGQTTSVATDVYGLGCLLHVLLSGAGPFDFTGKSRAAVIDGILHEEPLLPSRAATHDAASRRSYGDAAALAAALRGDLDLIVAKALRKPPDDRYGSVDAFAEDVRNVLAARPIGLRARERGYRLRCFVRRHRVAVAAGAIVAIVAVAALVLILAQSRHVAAARAVAESERDHARGVTEFLVNAFGNVDAFRTRSREVLASELLENAARELHELSADDAELTAAVGQTLAQLHLRLDMKEPARTQAALARAALARLADAPTLLRVRQDSVEAEIALFDSRFQDAMSAVGAAQALIAADPAFRDPDVEIRLAMTSAQARRFSAKPLEAAAGLRRSYEAFRHRPDIAPVRLEPMLKLLARHLVNDGDPAAGLALLDDVLAAQRRRLPDDHASVIETTYGRGQALYRLRRNDDAIAAYETAVAGFRKRYGSDYLELSNMLGDLGTLYGEVGRAAEADRLLREALRITLARGKSRRNVAGLYDMFAILYRDGFHDYAAAQRYAALAYAMTPAESRDSRAYTSRGLAETLLASGDWFEAMLHAESALPYMVESCGDCQQVAYLRGDVAYARLRLYDLAGAREWLTRDTLTTLRVWSRWPHNVRRRAEDIARTVGTAAEAD